MCSRLYILYIPVWSKHWLLKEGPESLDLLAVYVHLHLLSPSYPVALWSGQSRSEEQPTLAPPVRVCVCVCVCVCVTMSCSSVTMN